jgi:hypothetical protein
LIIVLESIRVLSISAIRRTPGRLHIGHPPGFRTQNSEKGGGIKCSRAYLEIIRLLNHTTLICPEPFQRKDQLLKIHFNALNLDSNGVGFSTFNSSLSTPEKIQGIRVSGY